MKSHDNFFLKISAIRARRKECDKITNCKFSTLTGSVHVIEVRKDKHSLLKKPTGVQVEDDLIINVDKEEQTLYSKLVNNILNKDTVSTHSDGWLDQRAGLTMPPAGAEWQKDIYYIYKKRLYKIQGIINALKSGTVGKTTMRGEAAKINEVSVTIHPGGRETFSHMPEVCVELPNEGKSCEGYILKTREWKKAKTRKQGPNFDEIINFFKRMDGYEGGSKNAVDKLWKNVVKYEKGQTVDANVEKDVNDFLEILNNGPFFEVTINFKLDTPLYKKKIFKYIQNNLPAAAGATAGDDAAGDADEAVEAGAGDAAAGDGAEAGEVGADEGGRRRRRKRRKSRKKKSKKSKRKSKKRKTKRKRKKRKSRKRRR